MIPILVALVAVGLLYWFPIRRRYLRWGAARLEATREMPGDSIVPAPIYLTTLAVTIEAPPDRVWPWLLQIGHRRGGLYSYDWLDRLFGYLDGPSSDRILPAFQHLQPGDLIPMGRGEGFPVVSISTNESLVMGGSQGEFAWCWAFGLYAIGDGNRTRLVSRNRARYPRSPRWMIFMRVLELTAFLMTRRMLIGIKQRTESLATIGELARKNAA